MDRNRLRVATLVAVAFVSSMAVVAWAQHAPTAASATGGDPINALWSLLGSSPVAFVLWQWAKSEQKDRREAVDRMLSMFETDADHKAALRERLKGHDDALTRMMDLLRQLERRLDGKGP